MGWALTLQNQADESDDWCNLGSRRQKAQKLQLILHTIVSGEEDVLSNLAQEPKMRQGTEWWKTE